MRKLLSSWAALMLLAAAVSGWASDQKLGPHDGIDLTPTDLERVTVGSEAPDFTLETHEGSHITLSDFRGKKNLVVVFYRGHW
jgi:cytochrome oxidase Cu insertion factor (SCO1/SenC/PrrC family)